MAKKINADKHTKKFARVISKSKKPLRYVLVFDKKYLKTSKNKDYLQEEADEINMYLDWYYKN